MKFELKTDNESYSKPILFVFRTIWGLSLLIIFCDVAFKFGIISRNYQIDYHCKLLSVDKSKYNFKKLSSLSNLKSKQRIWEFCKEFIN